MIIETNSEKETFELGKKIGENAKAGQIYTLTGDLGVGKTVFTQGLAAGLGITEPVNSPTFTIVQMYEDGRLPFYHFDVYRIGDIEEMEEIGTGSTQLLSTECMNCTFTGCFVGLTAQGDCEAKYRYFDVSVLANE